MVFAAKNDLVTKVITCTIAVIAVVNLVLPWTTDNEALFGGLFVGAIFSAVLFSSWLYKPKCYELTEAGLLIPRPIGTVKIGKSRIESVQEVEGKRFRFAIRTFGIGGVFGYFGSFYTSFYGSMTWYVTDKRNLVMLVTHDKKKIVISPDNKEIFLAEIKKLVN